MSTTVAAVSRDATAPELGGILSMIKGSNLLPVASFTAIGLLVAIAVTVFLPFSEEIAAALALMS